jgi:hypothetical protein
MAPPGTRAATASADPSDDASDQPGPRPSGRAWCQTEDRGDGMWLVRRTDHATQPGTDPQVVLGDLPAPRVGAGQGRCLRPVRGRVRRAARRRVHPARPDATRLAGHPRRACPAAERRPRLRPRSPQARPSTRTGRECLPTTSADDRSPHPLLRRLLRTFCSSQKGHPKGTAPAGRKQPGGTPDELENGRAQSRPRAVRRRSSARDRRTVATLPRSRFTRLERSDRWPPTRPLPPYRAC